MIDNFVKRINLSLKKILDDANKRYGLKDIYSPLFECSKEFILRRGKRIRPLLFVLSYKGYTDRKNYSENKLFYSAASTELLHDYMLIHDDVIDNSALRRGKPTLHKTFDKEIKLPGNAKIGSHLAIVAGDIIFAIAAESFLSIDEDLKRKESALKIFLQAAAYTGAGEFIDVVFAHKAIESFSEKEVFLIYTLKTAKYTFEGPLLMGAILAGADKKELSLLSRLGTTAGQAFQIYDDFLDLFATEEIIGKPVLSDLSESKKTLLVFQTYKNLKGKEKKLLKNILEKENKTLSDLQNLRQLVVKSGSYEHCIKKMASLQSEAVNICRRLKMRKAYKKMLEDIILKLSPSNMPINLNNTLPGR